MAFPTHAFVAHRAPPLDLMPKKTIIIDPIPDMESDTETETETIADMDSYLANTATATSHTDTHSHYSSIQPHTHHHHHHHDMAFSFGPRTQIPFATPTAAFTHFARTRPSLIAVDDLSSSTTTTTTTYPRRRLSYGQLAAHAQTLARQLRRDAAVQPGQRVPLVAKRGAPMVVAIWALLLCGAQYVPLDGGVVPDATLAHVLAESAANVLLCTPDTESRVRALFPRACVVTVDHVDDDDDDDDDNNHHNKNYNNNHHNNNRNNTSNFNQPRAAGGRAWIDLATPQAGCYVIYTSGTTGKPKGVDVTHSNVANLVCQYPGNLGVRPGTRVAQVLNISFDMAAWEIFSCLCNGGTLVIRGSDWKPTLKQIDLLICTPSILSKYPPTDYPNIRVVATAGEPTTQALADLWARHAEYWNCCGPTETTIVNTMSRHFAGRPVTIGSPTPNNNVYILDHDRRPVAQGQPGIMWAGGTGVSRGYVGLESKTREMYAEDPFANDGSRMYCTGDLGLWEPCGNIRILGRCDDQVKIKGFRVELDGISSSLLSMPGIQQAVTLHLDNEIHAFVASAHHHDETRILAHVAARQPYYAIPSSVYQLTSFPVTVNGKTDKKALVRMYRENKEKQRQFQNLSRIMTTTTTSTKTTAAPMPERARTISDCPTLVETDSISSAATAMTTTTTTTIAKSFMMSHFVDKQKGSSNKTVNNSQTADVNKEMAPTTTTTTMASTKSGLDGDLPEKRPPQPARGIWHRILIVYRTLFTIVFISNAIIFSLFALHVLRRSSDDDDKNKAAADMNRLLGLVVAANLTLGVLVRQDMVINLLYGVFCSVPLWAPLWLRTRCARIYHLGGVHSAAGVCATLWLLGTAIVSTWSLAGGGGVNGKINKTSANANGARYQRYSLASVVVTWLTCALCAAMMAFAWPGVRKKRHNLFERTHRFMGWTALLLFWIRTVLLAAAETSISGSSTSSTGTTTTTTTTTTSIGQALVASPAFWLLLVATASVASSWLFLRRVPVEAVPLSDHATVLAFTYTVPVNGTFTRISRRPLLEWHSFATIPQPERRLLLAAGSEEEEGMVKHHEEEEEDDHDGRRGRGGGPCACSSSSSSRLIPGYALIVSNAGDWTKSCIRSPPQTLWVRGLPTCGVMRIATLFQRIIVVATGSGIGPLLGHLERPTCATRLLWSTKNPAATFGAQLVKSIGRLAPNSVIHDTAVAGAGRPDLVRMSYHMAVSFEAEAVIIIANERVTKKMVYGLETRGIAAYGAIWDS